MILFFRNVSPALTQGCSGDIVQCLVASGTIPGSKIRDEKQDVQTGRHQRLPSKPCSDLGSGFFFNYGTYPGEGGGQEDPIFQAQ